MRPHRFANLRTAPRLLLLLLLAALLAGCGRNVTSSPNEPSNLQKWVAEVQKRPPPALDPLPVMQQFETFEYAAQSMRDPFSNAFSADSGSAGPRPDPNRRKQPLEEFPLDSLDMVGTIGVGEGQVALIMAPDKVTYRVRTGMYMGQSDGRVVTVTNDRIDLVELIPDGAGGWMERAATITLDEQ
jgi:type IV pilus assembly protein PilP